MLKALYRYEMDKLLHSGRFVLPGLLLFAFLGISYAIAPLDILDSFAICALVVFALMLSVGVMLGGLRALFIEQTMLVKLRRKAALYLGKVLAVAVVSLTFAFVSALAPLLVDALSGGHLFTRAIAFSDIASGLVLFWLAGLCGGMLGLLANPRLIRSRRFAVLFSALLGLLSIVKGALIKGSAAMKFVLWVLPPVYDASVACSAGETFSLGSAFAPLLWLAAYAAAETAAYVLLMRARRFE